MATQRPLKEGNVRTYQEKVALGFPDILASEMDADLDTIYAAWNTTAGGDLTGNYPNPTIAGGAVNQSKIATGFTLWASTATTVRPITSTNQVVLPGPTAAADQAQLVLGTQSAKGRFKALPSVDWVGFSWNAWYNGSAWAKDDTSKTAWVVNVGGNNLLVTSVATGAGFSATNVLTVDNAGGLTAAGNITAAGTSYCLGMKCSQGGGTLSGGYSNQVGLGWNGSAITAKVDNVPPGFILTVTSASDERVKTDVQEDVPGLDAVLALRPISFRYRQGFLPPLADGTYIEQPRHYGLIAQEAQPHVPLIVIDDESDNHYLELDYRLLVPVLIRAIQELAAKI